jgi:hypothetical protein
MALDTEQAAPPEGTEGQTDAEHGSGAPFGVPIKGGVGTDEEKDAEVEEILNCVFNVFLAFSNSDATMFSALVDNNCRCAFPQPQSAYDAGSNACGCGCGCGLVRVDGCGFAELGLGLSAKFWHRPAVPLVLGHALSNEHVPCCGSG